MEPSTLIRYQPPISTMNLNPNSTVPLESRFFTAVFICFMLLYLPAKMQAADEIDFNRDIRPILSSACFSCHGPDDDSREADLRLDTHDGALADLGDYAAIVPGNAEESEAMRRILSEDPDERMPPAEGHEPLPEEEIDLLRRWIDQGASWSEHWAFSAPERPSVPQTSEPAWVRNPIDAFVSARRKQDGIESAVEADRISLLRRLSLDLIGLPPTIEQVDQFLKDNRPDAYERQVERLLMSPHYGERWGRIWLDGARYADSDGYEKDLPRQVWFYRDWVINALNSDMPYDQFIVEQVAGDLLPNATQDQRVATGFLRNSMINEEGGADPEQFRMEAIYDRMDAIGSGVLGLTVRCSQCHSHKYDPLTHAEYYQMFAFLNNCHESQIAVYTPEEERKRQAVFSGIREIETQLQHDNPDWAARMAESEKQFLAKPQQEWVVAELQMTTTGTKYERQEDRSILSQGFAGVSAHPHMRTTTKLQKITAMRLELLTDPNLPFNGPGLSLWGTCAISEIDVTATPLSGPKANQPSKVEFAGATADLSLPEQPLESQFDNKTEVKRVTGPVEMAVDGKIETAWNLNAGPGLRNQRRTAVFTFAKPITCPEGTKFSITLKQQHGGWNSDDKQANSAGRFRISFTSSPISATPPLPHAVSQILEVLPADRTKEQTGLLFSYWRTIVPEWQEENARIEGLWKQHPMGTSQLVLAERESPRETHRLERGDFLSPQEKLEPGVPAFLHPLPKDAPPTRLTFARWLVDPQSPTTARAIVNRVWQAYFGTGIVSSTSDLGSQSEPPSHRRLLDWLAVEFMERGWSLKQLQRTIVLSATYRQSSDISGSLAADDPSNRLLARGPRFRVDAELVRDIALSASGLLNPKIGGPSVYPQAPEFLFLPPASYGPKVWNFAAGPANYRRALYTFQFRSVPYPSLQTFDAPDAAASCVRRARANTPLQALTMLNEPLFVECAKSLALRTVREGGSNDEQRLTFAFRQCVSRRPTSAERKVLADLLTQQIARFDTAELDPWLLAAVDVENKPQLPSGITPAQMAGWTAVSRVLLNLDETITKE